MTLSIITINFNNRDGLQKTIDSVLAQTWTDFEWIIIDGGSTDGSRELIEKYQEHFAYWCSEPDKGVYNAMNKGIAKAKGKYLNFMNSGDTYYEAETLKMVLSKDSKADILYGSWIEKYHHDKRLREIPEDKLDETLWHQNICHQAMFINRDLLKDEGYDESMKLLSDWYWNTQMYLSGKTFHRINAVVCIYDMYGMSRENTALNAEECKKVMLLYPAYMQSAIRALDYYTCDKYVLITKELIESNRFCSFITKGALRFLFLIRLIIKRIARLCHHKS